MAPNRKAALGRGLDALISTEFVKTGGSSTINEIPLSQIKANPDQPRRDFDEEKLQELAESIRQIGIIQPITLRSTGLDEYQIIAGERRFRAAGKAGLKTIPAYIRNASNDEVMQMALIENIQREDLNAIDIAVSLNSLLETCDMTQEQLSGKVGKNRATISNYIRLLRLPAEVQMALKDKTIDMGHARALLAVEDPVRQLDLFHQMVAKGWSVRAVEEHARKAAVQPEPRQTSKVADMEPLADNLSAFFGTKVRLTCTAKGNGNINIPFKNRSGLIEILKRLDLQK
ncbi:MAG: ParB/RepB/Spo0J family partition protein [Bacteroidaceae bacterium]|nr:ParB/RepB/Spo0J family partition protein [Bacteroidaceae bacterium]